MALPSRWARKFRSILLWYGRSLSLLDEHELPHSRIGLAQGDAVLLGEPDKPLPRPVQKLRIRRMGHVLRLHGRIHRIRYGLPLRWIRLPFAGLAQEPRVRFSSSMGEALQADGFCSDRRRCARGHL